MAKKTVHPSQLQIGMFVRLDLSWMKHNFMVSQFRIKSEKQLLELQHLGLESIEYDPDRSDAGPLPVPDSPPPAQRENSAEQQLAGRMQKEKQGRIARLKARRVRLNRCENAYAKTVGAVRKLMQNLHSQPAAAVKAASEIVGAMVDDLVVNPEATVTLVNMKGKAESSYYHSINVTILSLLLGRYLGLDQEQLRLLGVGALLHDLGHSEVPDRILRKNEPLTRPETELFRLHPSYGVGLAQRIGMVPPEAIAIIAQHHEMVDGSGYPAGLKGGQMSELAKIVALVNAYDNLCNQMEAKRSRSPHEAMSLLFAKEKNKYDADKLTLFITKMGVYPPGTVVRLSNGSIATVVSINQQSLLTPNVMVYDPSIPNTEAMIIDLQEEGLTIVESIRRNQLPSQVMDYLNLGENFNYFYDTQGPQKT